MGTQIIPPAVVPKEGVRTSSFIVLMSTLLVGGAITYLVRRGVPESYLEAHRGDLVAFVAQSIPVVYLGVMGFLSRQYMKYREHISIAKADALKEVVRGVPKFSYRQLLTRVKYEDAVLPVLQKVTSIGDISPPEHLAALTRLAQEVGSNRRDIGVILLVLSDAGILELTEQEKRDIHTTDEN